MTRLMHATAPFALALLIAACGGDSSSGGGTLDSPYVGTYKGAGTATVSTDSRSRSVSDNVTVFVHRDGLVQIGEAESTIYASGPLRGDSVSINQDAATLIDPECEGTVVLTGSFSSTTDGNAIFRGRWSSQDISCFGVPGTVTGTITVERTSPGARASRVLQTGNPAMLEAFRRALES